MKKKTGFRNKQKVPSILFPPRSKTADKEPIADTPAPENTRPSAAALRSAAGPGILNVDLAVIGGGAAGMAAAVSARRNGVQDILILERNSSLGGVLQQCIHNGFGLHRFGEDLTGVEFAAKYADMVEELEIPYLLNTFVIALRPDKSVTAVSPEKGLLEIRAKAVVLAMGCRERSRNALLIPGARGAGIMTAGTAQRYLNLEGYLPGKRIVIVGSGDIGLIMARQFVLEGCEVAAVVEIMPYSGGLPRNMKQCIEDFDIPVYYNAVIAEVRGKERVSSVLIGKVDENRRLIPGTEFEIPCDTLLISAGLIPENELTEAAGIIVSRATKGAEVTEDLQTSVPGIFSCGNVLHVHDLVDFVSEEGEEAGRNAAAYLLAQDTAQDNAQIIAQETAQKIAQDNAQIIAQDTAQKDAQKNSAEILEAAAMETETVEAEAMETEAVETEAVEAEAVEAEAMETEAVETETVEAEAMETEAVETAAMETEAVEAAAMGTESMETEAVEAGFVKTVSAEAMPPRIRVLSGSGVGGIVPQSVRRDTPLPEVSFMFRPRARFRDAVITARTSARCDTPATETAAVHNASCRTLQAAPNQTSASHDDPRHATVPGRTAPGGTAKGLTLLQKRFLALTPGEMCRITIPAEKLKDAQEIIFDINGTQV